MPYAACDRQGRSRYDLPRSQAAPLPFLSYGQNAYLGRMVELILAAAKPPLHLEKRYETDMAEGLKMMAMSGHGVAFLPESAVAAEVRGRKLASADAISHLTAGCRTLADNCVVGISANRALLVARVRASVGLATALNPYIGYENTTLIARLTLETGRSVEGLVVERGLLDVNKLRAILQPDALTRPKSRVGDDGAPR